MQHGTDQQPEMILSYSIESNFKTNGKHKMKVSKGYGKEKKKKTLVEVGK